MLIGSNIVLASIFPIYVYTNSFLMALTYVYCKRRPFEEFTLMFGFKVKSKLFIYLRWLFSIHLGWLESLAYAIVLFTHYYWTCTWTCIYIFKGYLCT